MDHGTKHSVRGCKPGLRWKDIELSHFFPKQDYLSSETPSKHEVHTALLCGYRWKAENVILAGSSHTCQTRCVSKARPLRKGTLQLLRWQTAFPTESSLTVAGIPQSEHALSTDVVKQYLFSLYDSFRIYKIGITLTYRIIELNIILEQSPEVTWSWS